MKTNKRGSGIIFVVLMVSGLFFYANVKADTVSHSPNSGAWEKVFQLDTKNAVCVEFETAIVTFKGEKAYRDIGNVCGPRSSVENILEEKIIDCGDGNLEIYHPDGTAEVFRRLGV